MEIGPLIAITASTMDTDGLNGVTVINRVVEDYGRETDDAPDLGRRNITCIANGMNTKIFMIRKLVMNIHVVSLFF